MFSMSMVAAGTASAVGPVLEACTEGGTATKYTTHSCLTASGSGKFQWNEIKGTEAVKISGFTLTLRDTGATGGSSAVRCTAGIEGAGTAGPGNKGRITKMEVKNPKSNCARVEGGCKAGEVEKVAAVDLPWRTEVFETEKTDETKLEGTGNGEPGWTVTCSTLLGPVTDTCTTEPGEPLTWSLYGTLSVGTWLEEFEVLVEAESAVKCSVGGAKKGEISGKGSIQLTSEAGLRIS
jgi:hypothetical protein